MKRIIFAALLILLLCYPEVVHAKKVNMKHYKYIGRFELTAYCGCRRCGGGRTSTGKVPKAGRTVAVDPRIVPYGSKLLINGNVYTAEDCGGAIKGNKIDVFFNSHSECFKFGRQSAKVYIKKKPKYFCKFKKVKVFWKMIKKLKKK